LLSVCKRAENAAIAQKTADFCKIGGSTHYQYVDPQILENRHFSGLLRHFPRMLDTQPQI